MEVAEPQQPAQADRQQWRGKGRWVFSQHLRSGPWVEKYRPTLLAHVVACPQRYQWHKYVCFFVPHPMEFFFIQEFCFLVRRKGRRRSVNLFYNTGCCCAGWWNGIQSMSFRFVGLQCCCQSISAFEIFVSLLNR